MEEDKTIWLRPPTALTVRIEQGSSSQNEYRFTDNFTIGRDKGCHLRLKDAAVSRFHVEVRFDGDQWRVHDLGSANGTYLDGQRIEEGPLPPAARLELGKGGPLLWLAAATVPITPSATSKEGPPSVTQVMQRYFGDASPETAGDHTMMIRKAFHRARKKQSRKYMAIIGVVCLFLIAAGGVAVYQQIKIRNMRQIAEEIFYNTKALELQIAQIEMVVMATAAPGQQAEMASKRAQLEEMTKNYDQFLEELGIYSKKMGEEDKTILRVARIFGECEVNMPEGFVSEVKNYIGKWRSTDRLSKAIARATVNGYIPRIADEMLSNHMPPQFFYLALQESNFNENAIGPKTRFGIAKGMWQFIPSTAADYGLSTGPLLEEGRYDPRDERHNFDKATDAAARYIRDIYNTEAQASGLLVMASYNWGENNIRQIIRRMPENPKERNFWQLLQRHKIPRETYDYVFYIFSAAVIGENPGLFGFDFDNPLG